MNPPRFDRAIAEVRTRLKEVHGVRSLVLFGSAARGAATEESDIDLLIDCDESAEDQVRRVLYDVGRRMDVRFSPVFYRESIRRLFDKQFLESIFRKSQVLFGTMPTFTPSDLDLQPLRLVSYRTEKLSPRKRAQMLRIIDGYRTTKRVGKKRYVVEKPGFLKEVGGWRIGRGAVVVPEESIEAFDEILRRYGAQRHIIPIWCQRP